MFRDREERLLERSKLSFDAINTEEHLLENVRLNDSIVTLPTPGHVSYPWNESLGVNSVSTENIASHFASEVIDTNVDETHKRSSGRKQWEKSSVGIYRNENIQCDGNENSETSNTVVRDWAGTKHCTSRRAPPYVFLENQRYEEVPKDKFIYKEEYSNAGNLKQKFEPSERIHSVDEQNQENVPESPITGRIPSPSSASSIASGKRLEWDSGADVGYNFIGDNDHSRGLLSTIERIALARGCSAALFERLDPEGTSGPPKPILGAQFLKVSLNSPLAKSTPNYRNENKANSRYSSENLITPIVEPSESVLPGGCLYVHSGEEFENDVAPSPQNDSSEPENVSSDDDNKLNTSSDNLHKKHSNSLINLSSCHEEIEGSIPRSQSHLNLLNKENHEVQCEKSNSLVVLPSCTLATTCSVSSSSVATIVQKPIFPKTSDKLIQTLPLKLSVGVQVCENDVSSNSFQKIVGDLLCSTSSPVTAVYEVSKSQKSIASSSDCKSLNNNCGGAHKKGSIVNRQCHSNSKDSSKCKVEENENDREINEHLPSKKVLMAENEKSAASSSPTVESSCVAETSCSGKHHGSPGVVDSANSFEYLPGHVFENALKRESDISKQSVGSDVSKESDRSKISKQSIASETWKQSIESDKSVDNSYNKPDVPDGNFERSDSCSSSLSKDIEKGVEQLQKLMSEKLYNSKTKKKLIRQIINKLVKTEYKEDHLEKGQFQGVSLSSNVPWVPATANVHSLKTANANKYIDEGDGRNKCAKLTRYSSENSSSERTKDNSAENAVSEVRSSLSTYTPSGSLSVPGDNEQSQAETSEVSSNIISVSAQEHWKMPTSKTEQNFEESRTSSGRSVSATSLLRICRSEHEKQLQWIQFEIDHLSHLKQLLEKQEKATKPVSNLADHEHKFHQVKPVETKSTLNKCQRVTGRKGHNWSKSTESSSAKDYDSNESNAPVKAQISSGLFLNRELSNRERTTEDQNSYLPIQEKVMRKKDSKHNLSTQTLSFDSYVVCKDTSSGKVLKENSSDSSSRIEGRLNVFVQTSPQSIRKHEKVHKSIPADAQTSQFAKKSYVSAVKCCCECTKSLRKILNSKSTKRKDDYVETFCGCRLAGAGDGPEVENVSFDQSANSESSPNLQSSLFESSNSEAVYVPQERNIASEIIADKSVQTSASLSEVQFNKPVWNEDCVIKKETARCVCHKSKKFCPCCGLLEMPLECCGKQCTEKPKKEGIGSKNSFQDKGKMKKVCDVSIQVTDKEPLAYLLTFEPTGQENARTSNSNSLPEIKLLVPVGQNKLENEVKKKSRNMDISKENQNPKDNVQKISEINQPLQEGEKKTQKLTLQEYLRANRPDYVQHADRRSQCLADLALLRELRKQKRVELMAMTDKMETTSNANNIPSDERIVFTCATVPNKPKLSARVMREQSRRKYHKTREVQNKLVEKKKKEDFRTNRLMAELFTKKLQKKVLEGVVNHSNTASVISSVP